MCNDVCILDEVIRPNQFKCNSSIEYSIIRLIISFLEVFAHLEISFIFVIRHTGILSDTIFVGLLQDRGIRFIVSLYDIINSPQNKNCDCIIS